MEALYEVDVAVPSNRSQELFAEFLQQAVERGNRRTSSMLLPVGIIAFGLGMTIGFTCGVVL